MNYEYHLNDAKYTVSLNKKDDYYSIRIGENEKKIKVEFLTENSLLFFHESTITKAYYARDKEKIHVNIEGNYFEIKELIAGSKTSGEHSDVLTDGIIYPPMPGKIIKILVSEGTKVKTGEGLIIVESMKMENEISSPCSGTIKKIHVSEGVQVNLDQPLIEIDVPEKTH